MTSSVQSQDLPQVAGVNVKAELTLNEFPCGVPVNAQVPHSSVGVQAGNQIIAAINDIAAIGRVENLQFIGFLSVPQENSASRRNLVS
jgi:hypothetical protein